jgi:signal peptidase I
MNPRWFTSRTVRHARNMRRHVRKIVAAQRDLLSPQAVQAVQTVLDQLRQAERSAPSRADLLRQMENVETVANKWLKSHPHPSLRENVEVFLVAIAVAMGIRTFFLQPFKIPTGSMQPTLFGITSTPDFSRGPGFPTELRPNPDFDIPNPVSRFLTFWYRGVSYTHVVAKSDGALTEVRKPLRFLLFNLYQRFRVGDDWYQVWFPVDDLLARAGLVSPGPYPQPSPKVFKKGEDLMKIKVVSGDHLFVDRLSYNFRRPRRGDIVVFETKGVNHPMVPTNQYYIKRLVGLSGEHLRIGSDQHLVIDGKRLDASTPGFERVYNFRPDAGPYEYFGHMQAGELSDDNRELVIRTNYCVVMGDNTRSSLDSRYFGDIDQKYVIGKSFFVYWPLGAQDGQPSRFGCGTR